MFFRFGQEVKVKLGSAFWIFFWKLQRVCTGQKSSEFTGSIKWAVVDDHDFFWYSMCDFRFYHEISVNLQNTYHFVLECVAKNEKFICTIQQFTMALSCVMISSVIFLKSYMSKSICTETMLKLSNTLALEYCVN